MLECERTPEGRLVFVVSRAIDIFPGDAASVDWVELADACVSGATCVTAFDCDQRKQSICGVPPHPPGLTGGMGFTSAALPPSIRFQVTGDSLFVWRLGTDGQKSLLAALPAAECVDAFRTADRLVKTLAVPPAASQLMPAATSIPSALIDKCPEFTDVDTLEFIDEYKLAQAQATARKAQMPATSWTAYGTGMTIGGVDAAFSTDAAREQLAARIASDAWVDNYGM